MSISGLTQTYQPNTLDGLNVVEADQIYLDGQLVNLDDFVPYTGANKTVNLGSQNIKTTHLPVDGADLVNLTTLQNAVTFIDTSVANSFLNKIVATDQTVAGKVTYSKELVVADERPVNLASKVVVGSIYPNITISSASVTVSQNFGTITNSGGVYQSTTNVSGGLPILIAFPITANKTYRFTMEVLVEDPNYTWYISFLQSTDNINPVTGGVLPFTLLPANTSTFQTVDITFTAVFFQTTGNIIITVESDESPPHTTNQVFKWKNLRVYEQGVALSNITTPSLTPDRVAVIDENNRLVASGINTTKLGYLDNVSSDIQTQLNGKLSTSGGTISGSLTVFGAVNLDTNKATTSYVPVDGVDLTNKSYVDGAISGVGSLYVLKNGDTMSGTLTVNAGSNRGVISYSNTFNSYISCRVDTNSSNGLELAMERTTNDGFLIQRENADLAFRTNNQERMRMSKTGEITIYNPFINSINSATIPFQTFITTENHYNENPSTTYLMSGLSGYLTLATKTTRTDADACLMWGTNSDISEVTSVTTDGSDLMPLNFGGSSFLFSGGDITTNNHFIQPNYYLNCGNGNSYNDEANRTQIAFGWRGNSVGYRHRITSEHNSTEGQTGNGNSLNFYLWSNSDAVGDMGTNHRMTIAGGGVGIKTLNPSAPLHVTANGNANPVSNGIYVLNPINIANQDAIVSMRVAGSLSGDAFTSYDISGEAGWATGIRNTDNAYVINQGWNNIRNQERFVINSSGNCGIGHSPSTKLDVNGMIRAYSNATGGSSMIYSENANGGDAYALCHIRNNTGSGCYWFLNSNGRSADGGANTATLRNDVGTLRLQANNGSYGMLIQKDTHAVNIYGGTTYATPNGFMSAGSLTLGATDRNYGGGFNWTSNTAGLLLECSTNTEIAVHDAGNRVASLMYYVGDSANVITIGRNMGWGSSSVLIPDQLVAGTRVVVGSNGRGLQPPEDAGNTYGSVSTYGAGRNGWYGYGLGNYKCFMGDTAGNSGIHDNSYGWSIYMPAQYRYERNVNLAGCFRAAQGWDRLLAFANGYDTGSGYMYYNAGNGLGTASDERIKKDFQSIPEDKSIAFIKGIKPTSFCLKGEEKDIEICKDCDGNPICGKSYVCNCRQDGFIAQNILASCEHAGIPKSVINNWYDYQQQLGKPDDERTAILGVNDRPILSHTVNAVKSLLNRIEVLEAREAVWVEYSKEQEKQFADYKAKTEERLNKLAMLVSQLMVK